MPHVCTWAPKLQTVRKGQGSLCCSSDTPPSPAVRVAWRVADATAVMVFFVVWKPGWRICPVFIDTPGALPIKPFRCEFARMPLAPRLLLCSARRPVCALPILSFSCEVAPMRLIPLVLLFWLRRAPARPSAAVASILHRRSLFEACLPWMVGTHVMGRMIAQLICYSVRAESMTHKDSDGGQLEGLFLFLQDNPDMVS